MISIRPKVKGILILTDGIPVPFLYNPEEIEETRSVQYEEKTPLSMSHPRYHYEHGNGRPLTWTMSARDFMEHGSVKMPFPLEIYIEMLYDLTYPIHRGGMMIDGPPEVLFIFQFFFRWLKIKEIKVTRDKWDQWLTAKHADITLTTVEVVEYSKQRLNSIKNLGF